MTDSEMLKLILDKVSTLDTKVSGLESDMQEVKQDISSLKSDMQDIRQKVTKTDFILENEIRVNIQRVALKDILIFPETCMTQ